MTTKKHSADCVLCGRPAVYGDDVCSLCLQDIRRTRVARAIAAWKPEDKAQAIRQIELLGA